MFPGLFHISSLVSYNNYINIVEQMDYLLIVYGRVLSKWGLLHISTPPPIFFKLACSAPSRFPPFALCVDILQPRSWLFTF